MTEDLANLHAVGERWHADETDFATDMKEAWGDWGVSSEVGKLRAVLMRRPGAEIETVKDPKEWRFQDVMDLKTAQAQQDEVVRIYREHGVTVHYIENMRVDRPNGIFVRDLVAGTPEGAIVGRPAVPFRRGEERFAAEALGRIGCPIVRTINGAGTFEGACLMWVDRKTAFLGVGTRCNEDGARQVTYELNRMGTEVHIVQIPYGMLHLDGLFNILGRDKAIIFPWQTPAVVVEVLERKGFKVIELPYVDEAKMNGAVNFVALEPDVIVFPKGNPKTRDLIAANGVKVIEADISEIRKGWGGLHCMTAFLKRDED